MLARRQTAFVASLALAASLLVALPTSAHAASLEAPGATSSELVGEGAGQYLALSWDWVPGASAYRVQVATEPTFGAASIVDGADTYARTFVPRVTIDVSTPRTLFWRVAAFGSGTTVSTLGEFTEPAVIARDALAAPALRAPADEAQIVYPEPVTFSWDPVPGAVSYELEYSSEPGFPDGATTTKVTTTGTSHAPSNPLARTVGNDPIDWHWRVRARYYTGPSGSVQGAFSPVRTFRVTWPAAASRPTLISPAPWTSGAPEVSDPEFRWSPVPGAKEYRVSVGQANDGLVVTSHIAGSPFTVSATTFMPPTALQDTNYYWQVTAVDASGNLGTPSEIRQLRKLWGMQAEATLDVPLTAAKPVTRVGTTDVDNPEIVEFSRFELRWDPIPRATHYEVEISDLEGTTSLTCTTASPSATIVAQDAHGEGTPSALKTRGKCLWHNTESRRIQPGVTYRWRVRGVDLNATSPTLFTTAPPVGTPFSLWSAPEGDVPGQTPYIHVVEDADPAPAGSPIHVDTDAWYSSARQAEMTEESAPLLEWEPVEGAVGYRVRIGLTEHVNNEVAWFLTPQTKLRPIGVFDNNLTDQPYYWTVIALTDTNWNNEVTITGAEVTPMSWRKSTRTTQWPETGAVTDSGGTPVLRWVPQFASSGISGGSRGYAVRVLNSDDTLRTEGKVEYPTWVVQNFSGGAPLPSGNYKVRVAPLDANGNVGSYSTVQPVTVEIPAPAAPRVDEAAGGATVTWDPSPRAVGYQVQYWSTATPEVKMTVPSGTGIVRQTAVSLSDLPAGDYVVRVRAKDRDSGSDYSQWGPEATFASRGGAPALVTPHASVLPAADRLLEWEPVDGAARYLVQLADSAGALESAPIVETTATAWVPTSAVRYGTSYYWRVTAVAEKGTGSVSLSNRIALGTSPARQVAFRTPPKAPTIGSPTIEGPHARIVWTALSGADAGTDASVRYVVRYRPDVVPEPDWTSLPETTATASSTLVTGLSAGVRYVFEVGAVSAEGQSPWSAQRALTTATAPKEPLNFRATPSLGSLRLTWSIPSGQHAGNSPVTGFELRYAKSGSASWDVVDLPGTASSHELTGLAGGSEYVIELAARNAVGKGAASVIAAVPAAVPGVPAGLRARLVERTASLTWDEPLQTGGLPVTGYVVEARSFTAGAGWSGWRTAASASASSRTATISSLAFSSIHEFRVAARNGTGLGAFTAPVRVTTAGAPGAPRGLKASLSKKQRLKLTWSAPASSGGLAVTGYKVERRIYDGRTKKWSTWSQAATTTTRSASFSGLIVGNRYDFRVIAINAAGSSAPSSSVRVTPAGKPGAPKKLKAKALKKKTRLTWKKAPTNGAKITKYLVQWSTNGKKWKKVKTLKASKRKLTTKVGKKGRTIYFRVIGYNKVGKGTPSDVVRVVKR